MAGDSCVFRLVVGPAGIKRETGREGRFLGYTRVDLGMI